MLRYVNAWYAILTPPPSDCTRTFFS